MEKIEIENNKNKFIKYCNEFIHRDGIEQLLEFLKSSDFFIAPSSSNFHLNEEGGLCKHSLNVFETTKKIYDTVVLPAIKDGSSPFKEEIPIESIAITTLFHDICKTRLYHKTEKWKKDETGKWVSYPGYEIHDEFPFGHGEKSCMMISYFIKLKQDELLSIRWHMGMFEMTDVGGTGRLSYRAAMEKSPLVSLLQVSDMLSSSCLEKTIQWK